MLVDIDGRTWSIMVSERQIPLLDRQAQHKHIREEVLEAVIWVIDARNLFGVRRLEEPSVPIAGRAMRRLRVELRCAVHVIDGVAYLFR
jgi:hypothetical protein